jgi:uncharacterized membrane protein
MLLRAQRIAAGYWLQLLLAMAIATLGLLLGSTAVVIGAMLVSPGGAADRLDPFEP